MSHNAGNSSVTGSGQDAISNRTLEEVLRTGNLHNFTSSVQESEEESDYDDDYDSYNGISDAQAQWEESVRQLEQLLTFILVPVVGKFLGRRFAYFSKNCPTTETKNKLTIILSLGKGCGSLLWPCSY